MSRGLHGKRILVTRPAAQAGHLAELIVAQGGSVCFFPLLEIGPAADTHELERLAAQLDDYALAVFVSPNAVAYALPELLRRRAWPAGLQAAAIGPSTAAALAEHGVGPVLLPSGDFDSEALLALPEFQSSRVSGAKVALLRGNGGRELLAETLAERGAQVDCVTCYRRSAPGDGEFVLSLLRNRALDALTLSSSEGLRNLLALLDTEGYALLRGLPVFVPHRRIAEAAVAQGLQRVVLTGPADAGIARGLSEYNWLDHD